MHLALELCPLLCRALLGQVTNTQLPQTLPTAKHHITAELFSRTSAQCHKVPIPPQEIIPHIPLPPIICLAARAQPKPCTKSHVSASLLLKNMSGRGASAFCAASGLTLLLMKSLDLKAFSSRK